MFRIKTTRGKTWAKLENADFVTEEFLHKVGKLLVDTIVFEAGKDFAKQGNKPTPRGIAEGMPRTLNFFDSFSYKVDSSKGVVSIFSSWPWIDQIIDGRPPYPMEWLTKEKGVNWVPMEQEDGTKLLISTPVSAADAWVHPGFKRHTFMRRAYENSRRKMEKLVANRITTVLKETPIL